MFFFILIYYEFNMNLFFMSVFLQTARLS